MKTGKIIISICLLAASSGFANEITRKLWETTIAVADENDKENKAELQQVIEKLKSLKFEQSETNQPAQSASPAEEEANTEPLQEIRIAQEVAIAVEPKKIQPAPIPVAAGEASDGNEKAAGDALTGIENHINDVETPYEMAEILFHTGRLRQAAIYYKQSLKSGSFENCPQDKAWILFQLANCLKEDEPAEAMKIYARLRAEHPDSTWAKMARQYNELLNLQLQSKPYELIKEQADDLQKAKTDEQP